MDMSVALAMTMSLLAPEPVSCDLAPAAEFNERSGPRALVATCPGEDPALQAAADAVLARMDMDLPGLRRFMSYDLADMLVMIPGEAGWLAAPGQILISTSALFPMRAAEQGSTHMLCAVAVSPQPDGRVVDAPVECIAEVERAERFMGPAMERALEAWRLAPTDIA